MFEGCQLNDVGYQSSGKLLQIGDDVFQCQNQMRRRINVCGTGMGDSDLMPCRHPVKFTDHSASQSDSTTDTKWEELKWMCIPLVREEA